MIRHLALGLIVFASLATVRPAQAATSVVKQIRSMAAVGDDLGIRVLLRKTFKEKISLEDWGEINKVLNQRPNVGFDVLIAWYRQNSVRTFLALPENREVSEKLEQADDLMLKNDFQGAFSLYQQAGQVMKRNGKVIRRVQLQLYFNILHSMGRALYGMKDWDQALEVYGWIPPTYFQARQIMFEKMWAAFRAGKLDRALGAVASQQSAFYSRYLEPESYLIKIYILKKLCRDRELSLTVASIKRYLELLKTGKISSVEWARNDLLRMSLANLIIKGDTQPAFGISREERLQEKRKIKSYLDYKFSMDKRRLISSLEKVLGYAVIAANTDQQALAKVTDLPPSSELEKAGNEYWPGSYEEWVDEIGSHVFIGDSQCKAKSN